jgi:hypothetical protein
LTFGSNQHDIPLAAGAALAAIIVVAAVGVAVRAPLSRVPENTMKFVVGVMLTSFGMFWGGEGAGAKWPGSDAALLVIVPAVAAFSAGFALLLRRAPRRRGNGRDAVSTVTAGIRAFLAFCYDFVIGDDWRVAAGVVASLAITYGISRTSVPAWWVLPAAVVVFVAVSVWMAARRS